MDPHLVATVLLEEALMDLEVAMAHQEAATVPEVASVAVHHLPDGMAVDAAATVHKDLDLADHLHLDMAQTHTTVPKAAWLLLKDSAPTLCKISLLEEDLRPAVARLSTRLSRWTNVLAVHPTRYLIKFRLMV